MLAEFIPLITIAAYLEDITANGGRRERNLLSGHLSSQVLGYLGPVQETIRQEDPSVRT